MTDWWRLTSKQHSHRRINHGDWRCRVPAQGARCHRCGARRDGAHIAHHAGWRRRDAVRERHGLQSVRCLLVVVRNTDPHRLDNLESPYSQNLTSTWRKANCQPNYWRPGTVQPDPTQNCGPYKSVGAHNATSRVPLARLPSNAHQHNHDTIAMVAIDGNGRIAAGTSTNGLTFKIVGRVGDSPIPGAGAYADSDVGGCGETGGTSFRAHVCVFAYVAGMRTDASTRQMATL